MTSFYKTCAVPMCKSTSITTPQKLFIYVPKNALIRRKWLSLARRHPASLTATSTSHFCEDHFDLPKDMENYVEYTTMGVVSRIRMRPGCLPTKFACQPNRANISTDVGRPAAATRQRLSLIRECEEEIRSAQPAQAQPIENLNIEVLNQDEDPVQEQLQNTKKIDKAVQICITAKYRSKTTQTETKSSTKKTSPIKVFSTSVCTSPFKIKQLRPFIKPHQFRSKAKVTRNSSNDDKSDSDVSSVYTPPVAPMTKSSSDTSVLNEPDFKREHYRKSMLEYTVERIKKRTLFYSRRQINVE